MKDFYVYILANGKNGTLYTGVTGDILHRVCLAIRKLLQNSLYVFEYNSSVRNYGVYHSYECGDLVANYRLVVV